jgi:hypothetical protein
MALCVALPVGPGILWRGFDCCRALPEDIESATAKTAKAISVISALRMRPDPSDFALADDPLT